LQPTALVHEVWLRLGGDQQPAWANRAHFFSARPPSRMRRILIENARRKRAVRHGGALRESQRQRHRLRPRGADRVRTTRNCSWWTTRSTAFAAHDARKAELVKQKYFVGLTLEEAADVLGISHRTAKRDWAYAQRVALQRE
jgi:RNA polymerase sigma factor (TIGR02999 family)